MNHTLKISTTFWGIFIFILLPIVSYAPPVHADITTGLQAHWKLDESSGTFSDSSGNSNTGTATGTVSTVSGKKNGGIYINGSVTPGAISAGNNSSVQITGPLTISAWVKPVLSTVRMVVAKSQSPADIGYRLYSEAGVFKFYISSDGGATNRAFRSSSAISANTWYHVVAVYDPSTTQDIYINGQLANGALTGTIQGSIKNSAAPLLIGAQATSPGNTIQDSFSGNIDDVRIYNRALTSAEALELYTFAALPEVTAQPATSLSATGATLNGTLVSDGGVASTTDRGFYYGTTASYGNVASTTGIFSPGTFSETISGLTCATTYHYQAFVTNSFGTATTSDATFSTLACPPDYDITTGLVGHWELDEGSGTLISDISGNDYEGTATSPSWTDSGKINKAMVFNGSSSFVNIGNQEDLQITGPLTISAWVNTQTIYSERYVVSKASMSPVDFGYRLAVHPTQAMQFYVSSDGGASNRAYRVSTPISANTWYHVVGVYDPSTTQDIYINGQLANGALTGTIQGSIKNSAAPVRIGAQGNTATTIRDSFLGTIDDVRIYNRALSAEDVEGLYNTLYAATVSTMEASSVNTTSATLNGYIVADNGPASSTSRGFEWGLTSSYGSTASESGTFGRGAFSANISGLTPGATYHYRAFATNATSTGYGDDYIFTASGSVSAPTVTSDAVSSLTTTSATMNGTMSSTGGSGANEHGFAYGTSSNLSTVIATTTLGTLASVGSFSKSLTSISSGTTYYYRAYARNFAGTSYGTIQSFTTTIITAPSLSQPYGTSLRADSATLNASSTSDGNASSTVRGFAYGLTTAYELGTTTETGTFGIGSFTASLSSLQCNTTYHIRAYATNSQGTGYSSDGTFTTSSCSVPGTPTNLTYRAGSTQMYLSWLASNDGGSPITDYAVEYKQSTSLTWLTFVDGISTNTYATITGLTDHTNYDFRVSAANSIGTSSPISITSKMPYTNTFATSTVFSSNTDGYAVFRIPATVTAPNGDILAFAEGRVGGGDDFGNIDIVMKRSTDGGSTWGSISVAAANGSLQAGNPGVVVDYLDPNYPNGRIFLVYNTGNQTESMIGTGTGVREIWYKTSTDSGYTWSDPVNITLSVSRPNEPSYNSEYDFAEDWRWYAILPGSGIQLLQSPYRGRIVIGANHNTSSSFSTNYSHTFYTDDHGETWELGGSSPVANTNENHVVELSDGRLMMNMRTHTGQKCRVVAYSSNGGESWGNGTVNCDLIDPTVQASLVRFTSDDYHDENRILFVNPASTTARANLTIKMSADDGATWPHSNVIDSGGSAYSSITVLPSGRVGVLYEGAGYATVRFATFDTKWMTEGAVLAETYYPSLTASLSADKAAASSGDTITYTASIENSGNDPSYVLPTSIAASNVTYTMSLPPQLQLVPNSISSLTPSVGSLTVSEGNSASDDEIDVTVSTIATSTTYSFTYQATVKSNFSGTVSVSNQANVSASNWDDATTTPSITLTVTGVETSTRSGSTARGQRQNQTVSTVQPTPSYSLPTTLFPFLPRAVNESQNDLHVSVRTEHTPTQNGSELSPDDDTTLSASSSYPTPQASSEKNKPISIIHSITSTITDTFIKILTWFKNILD